MVYGMILVGGATRLTDSGLSITDWKPISGALPPLDSTHWAALFEQYKLTAEYRFQNAGMTLGEFQYIYWWEWGHRLMGRLIGLVAVFGLAFFWLRGWLSTRDKVTFSFLAFLGGLQGAIGWWMVASGIGDTTRVDVAPYRLMVHFTLALAIIMIIAWCVMARGANTSVQRDSRLRPFASAMVAIIFLQMGSGALVAGLDAGRTYIDWPLMAGEAIPSAYWVSELGWRNAFENAATAQFNHRTLGYLIAGLALLSLFKFRSSGLRTGPVFLAAAVSLQVVWGILTLMNAAPVSLSLIHQGLGVIVLLLALRWMYLDRKPLSYSSASTASRMAARSA